MKARKENNIIKVYNSLPKRWEGVTGNYENFKKASNEIHIAEGFLDLIRPNKTEYQRYGEILDKDTYFEYDVIDFTQEEIEEYDQNQLDQDESANKYTKRVQDGKKQYKRFVDLVIREKDNNPDYKGSDALTTILLFNDALQYLKDGLQEVSRSLVKDLEPTEDFDIELKDKIKDKLNNYIDNNPL